jgi:hypothetical protein
MGTMTKEMKELMGEHEAIMAYMQSLTKSAANLAAPPAHAIQLAAWEQELRISKDHI